MALTISGLFVFILPEHYIDGFGRKLCGMGKEVVKSLLAMQPFCLSTRC